MPLYKVQAPDGRSVTLEGDSPPTDQDLDGIFASLPQGESTRQRKPSTQATIDEREAFGQQLQKEAQAPASEKAIVGALGIGKALVSPFVAGAKAIPGMVDLAFQPEKIVPTVAEGVRRAGMDVGQLIADTVSRFPKSAAQVALLGPYAPFAQVYDALKPKTLTPEEIQRAFEAQPMKEAVARERTTVPAGFPTQGAQPEVSEAIAEIAPLVLPVKGLKSLKGESLEADVGRSIRAAVKPPNAQIGARVEKAGQAEMGDIFNVNPNADKSAVTPLEGFHESVSQLRSQIGQQIGALRKRVGQTFTAGDDIAASLNKKADALERAGQPAEAVQLLRDRAENLKGKATDLEDLQLAVTTANQELTPFYSRSAMAQNPMLASAQTTANKVIAEEGGAAINKALESIGGPDAALLRKKWSNLTAIENQTAERLNKLINSASPEIQNAAFGALNSLHGMAGLIGLLRGYAEGAIPLLTAGAKAFSKKARAELKDSHTIISKMYDELRKNPPVSTLGQPAIVPLNVGGVRPQPSPTVLSEPTLQEFIQNSLRQQPQASF